MKGIIYKWTNTKNNKCYIGQTCYPNRRHNDHIKSIYRKGGGDFVKALKKYGLESFTYEVIETVDESKLNEREIYWINYFDSFRNGYNMTLGGDGHRGEIGEEGRKHIALGHIGIKHTEEEKKKISESHKKYWASLSDDEKNERISKLPHVSLKGEKNGMYGKHHSKESRKKVSETKKKNYIKRIWIHNDELEKLINISDIEKYIPNGWVKGRK